jgi:hypothetical protein
MGLAKALPTGNSPTLTLRPAAPRLVRQEEFALAPSVEIHIPASPNLQFANMLFFLVHSLADRAGFRGDWRVIVTQGRDGAMTADHPRLAWAKAFPVEFRQVPEPLWTEFEAESKRRKLPAYIYNATVYAQMTRPFTSDAVLFIDADTVVTGALDTLVDQVLDANCMAAKSAWQPAPVDIDAIIRHRGLVYDGPPIEYSGYGWSFTEPRFGPPYVNAGFVLCSREIANRLRDDLCDDFRFVAQHYPGHYIWQVAQCLTMIRQAIPLTCLDERFNFGIGPDAPPILDGEAGAALQRAIHEQAADMRVVHYCTKTPHFVRNRVMGDDAALAAFLATTTGMDIGAAMLREAFLPYRAAWADSQSQASLTQVP